MEYNDSLLPNQLEFEKLAKEYAKKLKNEKISPALIDNTFYALKYLEEMYKYIERNVRQTKLKTIFISFNDLIKENLNILSDIFPNINISIKNFKKFRSLNACLKVALFTEIELIENLFHIFNCNNSLEICQTINTHLSIIKKLLTI